MTDPVTKLLKHWPDRQAIHTDATAADARLDLIAVHRWFQRKSIPVKYWPALIEGGRKRGFDVSAESLLSAHSSRAAEDAA